MENVTLAVAKSYAEELLMGQGSIKGEDGKDGADGVDGFSPIIVENASNTDETYKLDITTKDGTFTTANLIGKQGVQGIQGIQGERGEQGETGLQGQQGIQGVKGEKGDDGYPFLIYKQYEVGLEEFNEADFPEIGLMFMIHVFEEDKGYPVYRYTADGTDTPYSLVTYMNTEGIKGEKGDRGEQGEQGIAGLDGKDGKDGTTYTPSIGEVTTVDSTELASATVSIKEDTKEAVFNFAIPKGNKGLDGKDGVQISDNETVENKTWSSKKTSDEIAKVDTKISNNLGELSELKTTEKSNLVGAINEVIESGGENVPPTSIAFNTDYITENDTSISMYEIRNGICYVTMDVTSVVSADAGRVVCTLPKPSSQMQFTIPPFNSPSTIRVGAILFANGNLSFFSLEAGQRYMFSFSYPLA